MANRDVPDAADQFVRSHVGAQCRWSSDRPARGWSTVRQERRRRRWPPGTRSRRSPRPLALKAVTPFLGAYRLGTKDRVLRIQDGRLVYVRTDSSSDLFPIGDGRYSFGADTLS